jgi:hypothetical protein
MIETPSLEDGKFCKTLHQMAELCDLQKYSSQPSTSCTSAQLTTASPAILCDSLACLGSLLIRDWLWAPLNHSHPLSNSVALTSPIVGRLLKAMMIVDE